MGEQRKLTKGRGMPGEGGREERGLRTEEGAGQTGSQVGIMTQRVMDWGWKPGAEVVETGDTCAADIETSEVNLPTGQVLQVGSAVLRVSEVFNDACVKWKARYGPAAYDWIRNPDHRTLRLRGILCSVEQDGVIRTGDVLHKA